LRLVRASALLHDRHHIFFAHDNDLLVVHLDLGTAVFPEEDSITHLHIQRPDLPVLQDLSLADGDHLAERRLLTGRVGNDDAASRPALLGFALDDDSIV
jgi:hypothetical protein